VQWRFDPNSTFLTISTTYWGLISIGASVLILVLLIGDGYYVPTLVLNSLDDEEYKAPYSLLPASETPSSDSIALEPDSLNNLKETWHFDPTRIVWLTAMLGHHKAIHGRVTEEFLQEVLSKVEFAE